jgi:hypothetical protein
MTRRQILEWNVKICAQSWFANSGPEMIEYGLNEAEHSIHQKVIAATMIPFRFRMMPFNRLASPMS